MPANLPRLSPFVIVLGLLSLASTATAQSPASTCPGTKFEDFFEAFAGSSEIQRAFTAQDVDVTEIDSNAQPEPRETTVSRAHADLRFPIIPTLAEQRQAGLETLVSQMENGDVRARLQKPDTGYQLAYVFRSRGACWELHAMADTSL